MEKEFSFNKDSKHDVISDTIAIGLPIVLTIAVIISYRGLSRNYPQPFYLFSLFLIFMIYYCFKWFKVLKKRRIKSIKCDLKTLDITLTTLNGFTIGTNLKEVKYTANRFGGISDLKIKGKEYPGVYNLLNCEELSRILKKYCKYTL